MQEISFTTQKAGVLKTFIKDGLYTLDFPARMPVATTAPQKLLQCLGNVATIEILKSRDFFVVLPDEEAVKNIEPDFSLMKELKAGVIVTAKGQPADVVSRFFYPEAGVDEDPVTGSAHCSIARRRFLVCCPHTGEHDVSGKQHRRPGGCCARRWPRPTPARCCSGSR